MAIAPIPPFPALSDRANGTYNGKAFDWASHMANTFVTEANALAANLNSIAAGGAYAIPYKLGFSGTVGSGAGGIFELNDGLTLRVDTKDSAGKPVGPILATFAGSGSVVKGTVRIVAQGDPSRWLIYNVLAYAQDVSGNYGSITAGFVTGSAGNGNPLLPGEGVLLFFQRTGDKGDKGDNGTSLTPVFHVNDTRTSGTSGGTGVTGGNVRTLNTVVRNTIGAGASLSGNQVTLPAGTYRISGGAPAHGVGSHQAFLYRVSDGASVLVGTSEYDPGATSRSQFTRAELVLTSPTTLQLRHILGSSSGNIGMATGAGLGEIYSELYFEKVA